MSVKICRIDDRLIHGQVVTSWLNIYQIEQIVVVSDATSQNETQKAILKMSTPPNVVTHILSTKKFLEVAQKGIKKSTMLLFDTVFDVEKIVDAGFTISELNVGGLRFNENREKISKQVAVTSEERACFMRLLDKGLDIEIRMVPSDAKLNLKECI